jgi:hypothetical protein
MSKNLQDQTMKDRNFLTSFCSKDENPVKGMRVQAE